MVPSLFRISCTDTAHRNAPEPVPTACIQRGGNDVGRQAIHRRPRGAAVGRIGGKTCRFYWPVIFAFQGPDDCGQRNAPPQRFGTGLVGIGKKDRKDGAAGGTGSGEEMELGWHADILAAASVSR